MQERAVREDAEVVIAHRVYHAELEHRVRRRARALDEVRRPDEAEVGGEGPLGLGELVLDLEDVACEGEDVLRRVAA